MLYVSHLGSALNAIIPVKFNMVYNFSLIIIYQKTNQQT